MKINILLLMLIMISANCFSKTEKSSELQCAEWFFQYIVDYKLYSGLPPYGNLRKLEKCMSEDLTHGLKMAKNEQLEFINKNGHSMKPPWIEGNLFASLYEGIHRFKFGSYIVDGEYIIVPVYMEYGNSKDLTEWIDIVVLKNGKNGWLVHDIKYCGTWAFRSTGTLLSNLPK
ncbi:hypothetical protein SAMN02745866_04292 [Alteromonadaceae bacterium Bs31]|nr:hypothetical protein SAMN02745866_04292 [Alteromonadaceae bacterium Bs31]